MDRKKLLIYSLFMNLDLNNVGIVFFATIITQYFSGNMIDYSLVTVGLSNFKKEK